MKNKIKNHKNYKNFNKKEKGKKEMKRRRTKLKLLLFSLKKQKSQTWFERKKIENHINFDKRANEKKLIEGPNWKNYIWKLELKYYIKNKQNFNKKKIMKIKNQN